MLFDTRGAVFSAAQVSSFGPPDTIALHYIGDQIRGYYALPYAAEKPVVRLDATSLVPRGNPWLFPGDTPGQPVKEIRRFWIAIQKEANLPGVRIHDLRGRLVRVLEDAELGEGEHSVDWDGRDATGRSVASGTYFARLEPSFGSLVEKIALLK